MRVLAHASSHVWKFTGLSHLKSQTVGPWRWASVGAEIMDLRMEGVLAAGGDGWGLGPGRGRGRRRGLGWSGAGHFGLAESDGQLQVLLLLEPHPPQPLLLFALALLLGPLQLLVLTSKLEQAERQTLELKVKRGQYTERSPRAEATRRADGGCRSSNNSI